jgi:hypothetical protein
MRPVHDHAVANKTDCGRGQSGRQMMKQLTWFFGLWLAGIATVVAFAFVIRFALET